jgi:hypothetical protein
MTKLKKLEQDVKELTPNELSSFHKWFQKFDAAMWDYQIEEDAKTGRLDNLAQKALLDHKTGRTKEI